MTDDDFWQKNPTFDEVDWAYDSAASGPRRRAFIESDDGEPAELVAYEDGAWGLGMPHRRYPYVAEGLTDNLEDAQRAVYMVWKVFAEIPRRRMEPNRA